MSKGMNEGVEIEIITLKSQVLNCMFQNWYSKFKKITFKSTIIPLPEEFVTFLEEDGIQMDEKTFPINPIKRDRYDEEEEEWVNNHEDEEQDANAQQMKSCYFPELENKIQQVIDDYEGYVIPKLNWSSPKDATWMNTYGNMKCGCSGEIFLLLKSSDMIAHDLTHAFDFCKDKDTNTLRPSNFVLVLRKFYDIKPSMEFRCFVKNNTLIGISQRDYQSYYPFLKEMKKDLKTQIEQFYKNSIYQQFPDPSFIFDLYISGSRLVLVDFNPWSLKTESLLFDWEELASFDELGKKEETEFRIVESQAGIRPSILMKNKVPYDLVDMSSGSALSELIETMKAQNQFHE